MIDEENILRLLPDRASNALSVLLAKDQRAQNQEVEGTLEECDSFIGGVLGGHPTRIYAYSGRASTQGMPRPPGLIPASRTNMVHNGVMRMGNKAVRQSVSLPSNVAAQVRSLAKARRVSANRMLVELIENGMEAEKRKQREFFDLAERFRSATDPEEAKRLGDQMGRMVFGD